MAIISPVRFVIEDGGAVMAAEIAEEGEVFTCAPDHVFLLLLPLIAAVDEDMA